jgi:hypothetical protein
MVGCRCASREVIASIGIRKKPGTVTIAGNLGVDVPSGTLNSVLKQAGLKR